MQAVGSEPPFGKNQGRLLGEGGAIVWGSLGKGIFPLVEKAFYKEELTQRLGEIRSVKNHLVPNTSRLPSCVFRILCWYFRRLNQPPGVALRHVCFQQAPG